ncbi:MAG: 3-phosphoshikimate 1-carboxyvinyltransferase [Proteobacteria bacterium]|jgi:3-phosphoshikimate 1-carboxyvinyltransferase|nr:3-phosphoshikimate 1-carboxyvinyltransferase [Pseudomonadota bacterium]
MKFIFDGPKNASKSLYNRALIVQSLFPQLMLIGHSTSDDVKNMKSAVHAVTHGGEVPCGAAGTVFRFIALRCARNEGVFRLTATERLMQRPQEDLVIILEQLGVRCELLPNGALIQSEGWKKSLRPLQIPRAASSQFASGLLLSAWSLPFNLEFDLVGAAVSDGYWQMTLQFVQEMGMNVQVEGDRVNVPKQQSLKKLEYQLEPDMSSAFAIAAAGALMGEAEILGYSEFSAQPDSTFVEILKSMGAQCAQDGSILTVRKPDRLKGRQVDLADRPDLFPVLAVLAAFAEGVTELSGAPHLISKESNRIEKTSELLTLMGVENHPHETGMLIHGLGSNVKPRSIIFDPDKDHRMAMAAGLARLKGFQIEISDEAAVDKSFPDFWKTLRGVS